MDAAAPSEPVGLINGGALCYMNTLLQCWFHTPRFRDWVASAVAEAKAEAEAPLLTALQALWRAMDASAAPYLTPGPWLNALRTRRRDFVWDEQNDIHETAMIILDALQKELAQGPPPAPAPLPSPPSKWDRIRYKADASWGEMFSRDYSALVPLVHGQTVQQIHCGHCGTLHHRYQPFSIWEVDLAAQPASLIDALLSSVPRETLNAAEATDASVPWTCDRCHERAPSEKTTAIWRWPPVLMICLKRFHYTPSGHMRKNTHRVAIPESMDLAALGDRQQPRTYRLCAVANHRGDLHYGHYIASVRAANGRTWIINDQHVRPSPELYTDDAYMLFYELA